MTLTIEGVSTITIDPVTILQTTLTGEGNLSGTRSKSSFCKKLKLKCPFAPGPFSYKTDTAQLQLIPAGTNTIEEIIEVIAPDEVTTLGKFEYLPQPVKIDSPMTLTIEGVSTITIEPKTILQTRVPSGAKIMSPFCEELNLTCPFAPGPFSYTGTAYIQIIPGGTTDKIEEIIEVLAPDGVTKLGCVQGSISVIR
ncbi:7296_t:CDS:2 [Entrophospora sp. SA101]|nr:7296_t:CDS:2 [Entrophospora sp. SA101]